MLSPIRNGTCAPPEFQRHTLLFKKDSVSALQHSLDHNWHLFEEISVILQRVFSLVKSFSLDDKI